MGPLYGRAAECSVVDRLLDDARDGRGGALVIRGAAGLGKSALQEYARGRAHGFRRLQVTGLERESTLAFAGVQAVLRPLAGMVERLPGVQSEALRVALGSMRGVVTDPYVVFVAVASLLSEAAAHEPLLCTVDDAQWLDRESADALTFAAGRLDGDRVAIVFAARDDDAGFDAGVAPELRLGGLARDAAEALLRATAGALDGELRERILSAAVGNPLALIEMSGGDWSSEDGDLEPVSLPIGGRLERRFSADAARLPERTRRLLLIVAANLHDDVATVLRAGAALGLGADDLTPAEEAGLLRVHAGRAEFRHPLVRSAVYQSAPSAAWREAHQALAGALGGPGEEDRRAWHRAAAAIERDEALASELERSAQRARARSGHLPASDALARAADLTPEPGERGRRLVAAAELAWAGGRRRRAAALLERARTAPMAPVTRARAALLESSMLFRSGSLEAAAAMALRACRHVPAEEPRLAMDLIAIADRSLFFRLEPEPEELAELLAAIRPRDARTATLRALSAGMRAGAAGDFTRAGELLGEGFGAAEASEDPAVLVSAAQVALTLGGRDAALRWLERAERIARTGGGVGELAAALEFRGILDFARGDLRRAEATSSEGRRLADATGQINAVCMHDVTLTLVAAIEGREDDSRGYARRAATAARDHGFRLHEAFAERALGLLELGLGRPDEALRRLQALPWDSAGTGARAIQLVAGPDLAEAALRTGRPHAAEPLFIRLETWARAMPAPPVQAVLERCRALIEPGAGAERHYVAALAHAREFSQPFELARTQLAYGEFLRRERRRREARVPLREAFETFDRLGAAPWRERARGELRATGETVRARDPTLVDTLTAQELQIARLAADGLSNRDIAGQLFLSRRTVDYHLAKVFRKLELGSRHELREHPLEEPIAARAVGVR
jgi:DNA-binding CsgD family transcriptional regulator